MLIDLHSHEKTYSSDSFQSLHEMTIAAREKGLDGICITDHDSQNLAGHIGWSALVNDVQVFVGCEVFTWEGDILVFGAPKLPAERVSVKALYEIVSAQQGVMIAAHPFRHNNRGLKDLMYPLARYLDAIEAFNGSTFPEDNERAVDVATALNLPMIGSGDSHHPGAIGRFATRFHQPIHTIHDLVRAIRNGHCTPAIPVSDGYRDYANILSECNVI